MMKVRVVSGWSVPDIEHEILRIQTSEELEITNIKFSTCGIKNDEGQESVHYSALLICK